jgi:hypothetical protein
LPIVSRFEGLGDSVEVVGVELRVVSRFDEPWLDRFVTLEDWRNDKLTELSVAGRGEIENSGGVALVGKPVTDGEMLVENPENVSKVGNKVWPFVETSVLDFVDEVFVERGLDCADNLVVVV